MLTVILRPPFILFFVEWIMAIVVFSCIASTRSEHGLCVFNQSEGSCTYGIFTGVIAFLFATVLIGLEFAVVRTPRMRPFVSKLTMSGGVLSLFFFICFCVLADTWRRTYYDYDSGTSSSAQAAIAFSCFSTLCWAATTYFAFNEWRSPPNSDGGHDPSQYEPLYEDNNTNYNDY